MILNNTWTPENMHNALFIIATHLNSGTYTRKCAITLAIDIEIF